MDHSNTMLPPFKNQKSEVTPIKSVQNRPLKFDLKTMNKFDQKLLQHLMDEKFISAENVRDSKYTKQAYKPFFDSKGRNLNFQSTIL